MKLTLGCGSLSEAMRHEARGPERGYVSVTPTKTLRSVYAVRLTVPLRHSYNLVCDVTWSAPDTLSQGFVV